MLFKLFTLLCFTTASIISTTSVRDVDSYEISMLASDLKEDFLRMSVGSSVQINYKDDSYLMLYKPSDLVLKAELYIYNPGYYNKDEVTQEETHGQYSVAEESTFEWNEIAANLVPTVCKSAVVPITPVTVETQCEKGVLDATRMISLQIVGTIDLTDVQETEDLENCVAQKLDHINDQLEYTSCLLKVLGDLKYASDALAAKIRHEESLGKVCMDNGYCYFQEDKQILTQVLENLNHPATPIPIYQDNRDRYCQLLEHSFNQTNTQIFNYMGISTYSHTCNSWVNQIYFLQNGPVIDFAVEHVSFTQDIDGNVTNHGTFFFKTHDFALTDSRVRKVSVNWENGQRIKHMKFENETIGDMHALRRVQIEMTNGEQHVFPEGEIYYHDANLRTENNVEFKGEFAGVRFVRATIGTVVYDVIQRT